MKSCRQTDRRR